MGLGVTEKVEIDTVGVGKCGEFLKLFANRFDRFGEIATSERNRAQGTIICHLCCELDGGDSGHWRLNNWDPKP